MLQFDPSNAKAVYRRGVAYLNLNRIDEAVADLLRASELNPKGMHVSICTDHVYAHTDPVTPPPTPHTHIWTHTNDI